MSALQQRNGSYRILFRFARRQHAFTLGQVSHEEARTKASQVDCLLMRLKQGLAVLPREIVRYIEFDGKIIAPESPAPAKLSLVDLRDRYVETNRLSLEANTVNCIPFISGTLRPFLEPNSAFPT